MKRYLKLVNFEFNRFLKLYLVLIGVAISMQIIFLFSISRQYLRNVKYMMEEELMSKEKYIDQFGTLSMGHIVQSTWFLSSIVICVVVLLIYVFFIWYRDWLGKNTFAYRLLMLPTARLNVYIAKVTTILIFLFGLVALQIFLLPIESQILKWLVPSEFLTDTAINELVRYGYLIVFYPNSVFQLFVYYGTGIASLFVVFTAILFERCYRLKGILFAVLYVIASGIVFFAPVLIDTFLLDFYFFSYELFMLEVFAGIIVIIGATWIGNYLLNNKIRV